jgi:hypothetical protein
MFVGKIKNQQQVFYGNINKKSDERKAQRINLYA